MIGFNRWLLILPSGEQGERVGPGRESKHQSQALGKHIRKEQWRNSDVSGDEHSGEDQIQSQLTVYLRASPPHSSHQFNKCLLSNSIMLNIRDLKKKVTPASALI